MSPKKKIRKRILKIAKFKNSLDDMSGLNNTTKKTLEMMYGFAIRELNAVLE